MAEESTKTETKTSVEASPASTTATTVTQKSGSKKTLIIVLVVLLLLCCIGSTIAGVIVYINSRNIAEQLQNDIQRELDNANTDTSDNTDTDNDLPAERGEIKSAGYFDVSVDDVRKVGNDYEIEMSITNTTDSDQTFSTILYLNLMSEKTDSYAQNFFSTRYQEDGAQLDGEVAAGETIRGVVVYSVEDDPSSLTLGVSESIFSDNYVEFEIM